MKTIVDLGNALGDGLAAIRSEFQIPSVFPAAVLEAAGEAARRAPTEHVDRTQLPFVTLDPASSTDLDQAFWIESSGNDLLLHYAIADVSWFVDDGSPIDIEAWRRGETLYLPDQKASLYPPILSERAASLLPDGPRPAIVLSVRVGTDGNARLDGAERAVVRSRAKLAYDSVKAADLPQEFGEFARRLQAAEALRGAARVDPPEQEVIHSPHGGFMLAYRPRLESEADNASLSLAANLAVANALQAHHTGIFRVMAEPDSEAVERLRLTARALGVPWPENVPLKELEQSLKPGNPGEVSLMMAIRRAGSGASYAPYRSGVTPWHAAMAATYAHATAPLRRLADRYVLRAVLAICNARPVPAVVEEAFEKLPQVMARADMSASKIDRAVVDLAETILLSGHEGEAFDAVITDVDERGAKVQLCHQPVVARLATKGLLPGDSISVRLMEADKARRTIAFELAQGTPAV
ncbi:RNB domain-containing ribonuclease [Sphingobium bisphenolivorans]|uniref:RNB domain-containing ribonuclease n=1 Tax=Sphingobium bisphenolivorans TaxID=1335760 RepID=UPI0003AAA1A9|nr:RNB domain-containing ribonuclease [Sphingobium bisphenolivorans]